MGEEIGLVRVRFNGAVKAADDLLRGDVLVPIDRAQVDGGCRAFSALLLAVFAEPE